VTGSVDQNGNVQAVGGHRKIEGPLRHARRSIHGTQLIPAANIQNLMLDEIGGGAGQVRVAVDDDEGSSCDG
jgi:predicted ATP-dependent protease